MASRSHFSLNLEFIVYGNAIGLGIAWGSGGEAKAMLLVKISHQIALVEEISDISLHIDAHFGQA